jgi:hypothetical protein
MSPGGAMAPLPQKIQLIGYIHLGAGIINLMVAVLWGISGVFGIFSIVGVVFCCPSILLFPIAALELFSAYRHLSSDTSTLAAPRLVAYAELASILGCSTFSVIGGVITLLQLNDPEVKAFYAARGGN